MPGDTPTFEELVNAAATEDEVLDLVAVNFPAWKNTAFLGWYSNWYRALLPEDGFSHFALLKLTAINMFYQGAEEPAPSAGISWEEWDAMTPQQQAAFTWEGGQPPVLEVWDDLPFENNGLDWAEWIGMTDRQRAFYVYKGGSAPSWVNQPDPAYNITQEFWDSRTPEEQQALLDAGFSAPAGAPDAVAPTQSTGFDGLWDLLTEEQILNLLASGNVTGGLWQRLTPEQRADFIANYPINLTYFLWGLLTEEERAIVVARGLYPPEHADGDDNIDLEAIWDALTDDQKGDLLASESLNVTSAFWDLLTDDQKQQLLDAGYGDPTPTDPEEVVAFAATWPLLSPEAQQAHIDATPTMTPELWGLMSPDQRAAYLADADIVNITYEWWSLLSPDEQAVLEGRGFVAPEAPPETPPEPVVYVSVEDWDALSDEEKDAILAEGNPVWESLSEEEQAEVLENGTLGLTSEFWESLSPEQQQTLLERGYTAPSDPVEPAPESVNITQEFWDSLSEEEQQDLLDAGFSAPDDAEPAPESVNITQEFWDGLSEEEQQEYLDQGFSAPADAPEPVEEPVDDSEPEEEVPTPAQEYWDSLDEEEQQDLRSQGLGFIDPESGESVNITQEFWDSLTEEQKEALIEAGFSPPTPPPEQPQALNITQEYWDSLSEEEQQELIEQGFVPPSAGPTAVEETVNVIAARAAAPKGEPLGPEKKMRHQPAEVFGQLSSDGNIKTEYLPQPGVPVHGEKKSLNHYSPFTINIEMPDEIEPLLTWSAGDGDKRYKGTRGLVESIGPGQTSTQIDAKVSSYKSFASTKRYAQALRPYNPALFTVNQYADIFEQILDISRTPPLILLINPTDMTVNYNQLLNYSERTRHGYVYQAWGEENVQLNFSGRIGAFYAGEAKRPFAFGDFTKTENPTGNQEASRKYSASYQNLMNLQAIYFNNGYIRDRANSSHMRPSLAHHMIGHVCIRYDGKAYHGHFDKFQYSFDDTKNRGGLQFSFDFTAFRIEDFYEAKTQLKPLDKPDMGGWAGAVSSPTPRPETWGDGAGNTMWGEDSTLSVDIEDLLGWDKDARNAAWWELFKPDTTDNPGHRGIISQYQDRPESPGNWEPEDETQEYADPEGPSEGGGTTGSSGGGSDGTGDGTEPIPNPPTDPSLPSDVDDPAATEEDGPG